MEHSKLPPHNSKIFEAVEHQEVFSWKEGTFIENIAVHPNGDIFVTDYPVGAIYRVSNGKADTFVTFPLQIAGLAFDADDNLFVTGGSIGTPPGIVYKVRPDGSFEKWLDIPDAIFLNRITPLNKEAFLTVDSLKGTIYSVRTDKREVFNWLTDERFGPDPELPGFPGINGIKRFGDDIYVSNTAYGKIFKVAIVDGEKPGKVELFASDLCCDDLAIDVKGNLYLTSHMHNSLVMLSPTGERVTIAGPDEGMVGSTSCAFGRTKADAHQLYVVTEGGIAVPYNNQVQKAKLIGLSVNYPGAPLL